MKRASEEFFNRISLATNPKKRARWGYLTLLGESVLKHRLIAITLLKHTLLLLDMSISYFSFPARTELHA